MWMYRKKCEPLSSSPWPWKYFPSSSIWQSKDYLTSQKASLEFWISCFSLSNLSLDIHSVLLLKSHAQQAWGTKRLHFIRFEKEAARTISSHAYIALQQAVARTRSPFWSSGAFLWPTAPLFHLVLSQSLGHSCWQCLPSPPSCFYHFCWSSPGAVLSVSLKTANFVQK